MGLPISRGKQELQRGSGDLSDFEVLQVPFELERMTELYRKVSPRRVLEIGSWDGGTLRVWLTEGHPEFLAALDLHHRKPNLYEGWRKPGTQLEVLTADSQSEDTKEKLRALAPFDWVFVDGDHDESAVRSDAELGSELMPNGGVLVFHDIARGRYNEGAPGPEIVFGQLANTRRSETYIDNAHASNWAHGVGVIYL